MKVGAGGGSALVTGRIEGGLVSGVPPFRGAVGYQTPDLWVSGFRWCWAISAHPAPAAAAELVVSQSACYKLWLHCGGEGNAESVKVVLRV